MRSLRPNPCRYLPCHCFDCGGPRFRRDRGICIAATACGSALLPAPQPLSNFTKTRPLPDGNIHRQPCVLKRNPGVPIRFRSHRAQLITTISLIVLELRSTCYHGRFARRLISRSDDFLAGRLQHPKRRLSARNDGMNSRLAIVGCTLIAVAASFVAAPFPAELVLQHIPTLAGLILLVVATVKYRVSRVSFACSICFLWIHIVGARWIYSYVPYDHWSAMLTGHTVSELFGWKRNHYDRMVHLASGLLGLPLFSEMLQAFFRMRPLPSACLAISCVLATGAAYEILEWQIAMLFSPAMAESYNGQQGDIWDAQKDMALALLGAFLCFPLIHNWVPPELATERCR
jgi:putative membrane protein